MAEEYLRLVGPIFDPRDLDTLVALKQDRDLRSYAAAFAAAMHKFRESQDVRTDLLKALREAMGSATLAKRLGGVFSGTATALSVVGLVPVIGTAVGAVGLGAEGAATVLERRERSQSWFEFAGQVKRVASVRQLERAIQRERSAKSCEDQG